MNWPVIWFTTCIALSALCFAAVPLIRACIIPLGSDCRPDVPAIASKAVSDLVAKERMTMPIGYDISIEQSGDGIDEPRRRFYRLGVDRSRASNGQ